MQVLTMGKFAKFWRRIWKVENETPNKKWREEIKESMKDKIRQVEELQVSEQELGREKTCQHRG